MLGQMGLGPAIHGQFLLGLLPPLLAVLRKQGMLRNVLCHSLRNVVNVQLHLKPNGKMPAPTPHGWRAAGMLPTEPGAPPIPLGVSPLRAKTARRVKARSAKARGEIVKLKRKEKLVKVKMVKERLKTGKEKMAKVRAEPKEVRPIRTALR